MSGKITTGIVGELFELTFRESKLNYAGLALKAAKEIGLNPSLFLSAAIQRQDAPQFKLVDCLMNFARHDQLDLLIQLLEDDSLKVKLCSIACLEILRDPRALEPLELLFRNSEEEVVREKAKLAYDKISSRQVPLKENTIFTYKELTPLEDVDIAAIELALKREISEMDVAGLLKLLSHPTPELRKYAEAKLINSGIEIRDSFYEALIATEVILTEELFSVLSFLKDPRTAPLVIKWIRRDNSCKKLGAIEALVKIGGGESAIYLAECIVSNSDSYQELRALIEINNPPVSYLISEYTTNEQFRRRGAVALAQLLGTRAVDSLMNGFLDRFREVRENAEMGLAYLQEESTYPLVSLFNATQDENIKVRICRIFGRTADKNALNVLIKAVNTENKVLRISAIEAVSKIADYASLAALTKLIESDDTQIIKLVAKGLGIQAHLDAVIPLSKIVNHPEPAVRIQVVNSLNTLAREFNGGNEKMIQALSSRVEDQEKKVAKLAESSLLNLAIDYENAFDHLEKLPQGSVKGSKVERIIHAVKEIRIEFNRKKNSNSHMNFDGILASVNLESPKKYGRSESPEFHNMFSGNRDTPKPEIPQKIIKDEIQLAVTAPRTVCPNRSFILDVWAYFEKNRPQVYRLASESQRDEAMILRSKGPVQVNRGTTLEVRIDIPDFNVKQTDIIFWGGKTGNCNFAIKVPKDIEYGLYLGMVSFHVDSLLIAKLNFDIEVGEIEKEVADLTTDENKVKSAFASYASEDRDKVLGRIQGMQKLLPQLDVFLDVASLRSGQNWEQRLKDEIKSRDVLYLFWSTAASKSPYVELEWRVALSHKGINHIDPVPLEPPKIAPPPIELSALHFNEWTLAFEK